MSNSTALATSSAFELRALERAELAARSRKAPRFTSSSPNSTLFDSFAPSLAATGATSKGKPAPVPTPGPRFVFHKRCATVLDSVAGAAAAPSAPSASRRKSRKRVRFAEPKTEQRSLGEEFASVLIARSRIERLESGEDGAPRQFRTLAAARVFMAKQRTADDMIADAARDAADRAPERLLVQMDERRAKRARQTWRRAAPLDVARLRQGAGRGSPAAKAALDFLRSLDAPVSELVRYRLRAPRDAGERRGFADAAVGETVPGDSAPPPTACIERTCCAPIYSQALCRQHYNHFNYVRRTFDAEIREGRFGAAPI